MRFPLQPYVYRHAWKSSLHVRDWKRFLRGRYEREIAIAQVSHEMADYLDASSRNVFLHQDYARKAVEKHGLGPEHLPLIFEVVDYGLAVADRPLHITFFHHDTVYVPGGQWFQVSVKRGFEDKRIFLATFHRARDADLRRALARHKPIREACK